MQMATNLENIRRSLIARGVCSSSRLQEDVGVNQSTVSRALAALSDNVIKIGRGRASRYGWLSDIEDLGNHWPLYTVSEDGLPEQVGVLYSLANDHWFVEGGAQGPWRRLFEDGEEIFPDIPWFLHDIRPQGFLGRCFARTHAETLGASPDPTTWPGRVVIEAALRFGSDLPGSFAIGREAMKAALNDEGVVRISAMERSREYPRMAESVLKGEVIGSSAGGEQRKFSLLVDGTHVLVKFSPGMDTPAGERWADLLACEYLANRVMSRAGMEVPHAEIIDEGGRRFLQTGRFDRTPQGRRAVVSLAALDAAFVGEPHTDWSNLSRHLQDRGIIKPDTAARMRMLDAFGEWIGNNDRHFGNLSFYLPKAGPLSLTPVYDMLPMVFRPNRDGIPPSWDEWSPGRADPSEDAAELAGVFWNEVAHSDLVTEGLRKWAGEIARGIGK